MKDNAIILDENLLIEQNLSIDEFLTILGLSETIKYTPNLELLEVLQEKQFLKIIKDNNYEEIQLREKSKLLIEFVTIDRVCTNSKKTITKSDRLIKSEVDSFIKEFRLKWKGLKAGSMGSEKACRDKMCRWIKENPEYTKEQILKAADIYLNTLDDLKYVQRADYFIFKKEGPDENSRLSAFVDEEEVLSNWTTELK